MGQSTLSMRQKIDLVLGNRRMQYVPASSSRLNLNIQGSQ